MQILSTLKGSSTISDNIYQKFRNVFKILLNKNIKIKAREAEDSKRMQDENCEKSGEKSGNVAEIIVSYLLISIIYDCTVNNHFILMRTIPLKFRKNMMRYYGNVLQLENVHKIFPSGEHAVRGVNMSVRKGQVMFSTFSQKN